MMQQRRKSSSHLRRAAVSASGTRLRPRRREVDRVCLCLAQPRDTRKEVKNLSITTAAVALAAALDAGQGRGGGSGGVVVDEEDGSGGGSCDDWFPLTTAISLLHVKDPR